MYRSSGGQGRIEGERIDHITDCNIPAASICSGHVIIDIVLID
jgi:hypothetical protein